MLGEEIFCLRGFSSACALVRAGGMESCWVRKFSICEDFLAFVRAGCIESCWVRKFSICEDFSSVYAFVRAGGIELYWVRNFSICENFSGVCVCLSELDV